MKGCLLVVGFVVIGAALALGVVVLVERNGAETKETLTEEATDVELTSVVRKTLGPRNNRRELSSITYRYTAGERTFESSALLEIGDVGDVVCFDPEDPAVHGLQDDPDVPCGDAIAGGVREADEVSR